MQCCQLWGRLKQTMNGKISEIKFANLEKVFQNDQNFNRSFSATCTLITLVITIIFQSEFCTNFLNISIIKMLKCSVFSTSQLTSAH